MLLLCRSTEQQTARVCLDAAPSKASVVRLLGPSLTAKLGDGITWKGQTFDGSKDGLPKGAVHEESVSRGSSSCYEVTLPGMSAAILRVPLDKEVSV